MFLTRLGADSRAIITGDMMHHPCQIAYPDWGSIFDSDTEIAVKTRINFLDDFADGSTLVIGTHFPTPTAGYLVADAGNYRFVWE